MDNNDKLFRRLQLVIDKETLGFPETPSGSDQRLLKQLFSPEQAIAVIHLTYKFSTVEQVFDRAEDCEYTIEELERVLDDCARRGMIGYRKKDGVKYYRTIHYLLGMAEGGIHEKPTKEYFAAVNEYARDGLFWKAFLATKVSQMRTIPLKRCIGCGNCIPRCPVGAIELLKKEDEIIPPLTGEDLNEVIMTNK